MFLVPHRLWKRQSLSTTVLFRVTLTCFDHILPSYYVAAGFKQENWEIARRCRAEDGKELHHKVCSCAEFFSFLYICFFYSYVIVVDG